jgi:hypothetical protein
MQSSASQIDARNTNCALACFLRVAIADSKMAAFYFLCFGVANVLLAVSRGLSWAEKGFVGCAAWCNRLLACVLARACVLNQALCW